MNSKYQEYLIKKEIEELRHRNSRIERINKIVEFIENQQGRVISNIQDWHRVNRDFEFRDQLRCDLWCSETTMKECEQIIEEYNNERSGLPSDSDGIDVTYDIDL